jgi:hypothetical protein
MERFVGEAIESVLNQTFRDFEFIIVDFGSTDRSQSIISRHQARDSRIQFYVIHPCSLADARNAGCLLTRGRYIALLDADDIAFPDRLERQVAYLERHPEIALLGGAIQCTNSTGLPRFRRSFPTSDSDVRAALSHETALHQTTVMMRREVFGAVKGYRKAFALSEDYDLWLRVVEHFQVANLAEPLVNYRFHSGQLSVRRLRQEVMCWIAARASAQIRASGGVDPLWDVDEITPEVLALLGISEAAFMEALVKAHCDWMNAMLQASNVDAALGLIEDMLQLPRSTSANGALLSNACLTAARIHYKRRAFRASINSTATAIRIRPVVVGRPIKKLLNYAISIFRHGGSASAAAVPPPLHHSSGVES